MLSTSHILFPPNFYNNPIGKLPSIWTKLVFIFLILNTDVTHVTFSFVTSAGTLWKLSQSNCSQEENSALKSNCSYHFPGRHCFTYYLTNTHYLYSHTICLKPLLLSPIFHKGGNHCSGNYG